MENTPLFEICTGVFLWLLLPALAYGLRRRTE
jgi:hypothetical protein